MGRRRLEKRNIRKLQYSHGSYHLNIPIEIVRAMKLKERERVIFEYDRREKRIIIRDFK